MRESKQAIMRGIDAESAKILANNTVEYRKDGTRVIRLHHTDIMTFLPNGKIRLNSGGWQTVTTKERLNRYLPRPYGISQRKGQWSLCAHWSDDCVPFYDGIEFDPAKGLPKAKVSVTAKNAKLAAKINRLVDKVYKMEQLPMPGPGDCWFCNLRDKDGHTMGELGDNTDHLMSHIKEGYLHGSLIANALAATGRNPAYAFGPNPIFTRATVAGALRRYLKREVGLAV